MKENKNFDGRAIVEVQSEDIGGGGGK